MSVTSSLSSSYYERYGLSNIPGQNKAKTEASSETASQTQTAAATESLAAYRNALAAGSTGTGTDSGSNQQSESELAALLQKLGGDVQALLEIFSAANGEGEMPPPPEDTVFSVNGEAIASMDAGGQLTLADNELTEDMAALWTQITSEISAQAEAEGWSLEEMTSMAAEQFAAGLEELTGESVTTETVTAAAPPPPPPPPPADSEDEDTVFSIGGEDVATLTSSGQLLNNDESLSEDLAAMLEEILAGLMEQVEAGEISMEDVPGLAAEQVKAGLAELTGQEVETETVATAPPPPPPPHDNIEERMQEDWDGVTNQTLALAQEYGAWLNEQSGPGITSSMTANAASPAAVMSMVR